MTSWFKRKYFESKSTIAKYKAINREYHAFMEQALRKQIFPIESVDPLVNQDLKDHVSIRLAKFRKYYIKWLAKVIGIEGKKFLEIGCGTGSSSLALAEQGARLISIDVDEPALEVAKQRMDYFNLANDFRLENADGILKYRNEDIHCVILFASLEHMTLDERIKVISDGFELLPPKGFFVVLNTPNRLWYFDQHTSFLPFFMWLPPELGRSYKKFSSREKFKSDPIEGEESWWRWGAGVSYHEFDIALGDGWRRFPNYGLDNFLYPGPINYLRLSKTDRIFSRFLKRNLPENIDQIFASSFLNFAIQKGE